MPTYTGKYSDDKPRLNRQGSERADEAENATSKPVGRQLDIEGVNDGGIGGGSAPLPKKAGDG
jgi:hypothetical protein